MLLADQRDHVHCNFTPHEFTARAAQKRLCPSSSVSLVASVCRAELSQPTTLSSLSSSLSLLQIARPSPTHTPPLPRCAPFQNQQLAPSSPPQTQGKQTPFRLTTCFPLPAHRQDRPRSFFLPPSLHRPSSVHPVLHLHPYPPATKYILLPQRISASAHPRSPSPAFAPSARPPVRMRHP